VPHPSGGLDSLFCQQVTSLDPSPRRWLIAHSGGLDSQVLLHLAARHLPAASVQVLHINHQLQSGAEKWAQFSAAQAKALGLDHQTVCLSLSDQSENSAREGRYQVFSDRLRAGDCLLMGHHADDQAETLLFRLLRGSGLRGLTGIPRSRPLAAGQLLRPLLGATRTQLEDWAQQQGLDWVDDPTNAIDDYDRNFLRNRVMPLLRERWPGLAQRWGQTATQLADAEQLLNQYLDRDLLSLQGAQRQLNCQQLPASAGQRRALLRRWLQQQGISVEAARLMRIETEVIGAQADAQPLMQLGELQLRRYQQQLFIVRPGAAPASPSQASLATGEHRLGDGVLSIAAGAGLKTLDGLKLVRRQGGEYLRPAGRGGRCSLKKLLQEKGIPPWQRSHWPLLMSGEEIVAVPGLCVCENWQTESNGFLVNWTPF